MPGLRTSRGCGATLGKGVTLPARPPRLCRVLNQTGITFNHLNSLKLGFSSSHV